MSQTMLINGLHAEELRVAIVDNRILEMYEVEVAEAGQRRGNIYRGIVANIEPTLDAAFIDIGANRHGFLARHDIVPQAYQRAVNAEEKRPRIDQILQKGQPIDVQVTKDEVGQKGATLTTNLSLPGRYLVFLPFEPQRGLSRKVEDEEIRRKVKERAKTIDVPDGAGFIIRTNGVDQAKSALKTDLNALARLWRRIQDESKDGRGPKLLYDDQDLVVHAIRDYLDADIEQVLVDEPDLYDKAEQYIQATMPRSKVTLTLYEDRVPLFSRYNLEPQISAIYRRSVPLPSGASIVIDHAEALTAIDVNSGKAKLGTSQEETAVGANIEAAEEIARQLRLRDIGGLIVADFIDMRQRKHQRDVEKALREAMKKDKARNSIGSISKNGLLEINRQRIRQSLRLRTHRLCTTCSGVGWLMNPDLVGLSLLRRVEARAASGRVKAVRISLDPELAERFQNHRRRSLAEIERDYQIQIEVCADKRIGPASERLDWVSREEGEAVPVPPPRALERKVTAETLVKPELPERPDGNGRPASPAPAVAASDSPARGTDGPEVEGRETDDQDGDSGRRDESRSRRSRRRRNRRRGRRDGVNGLGGPDELRPDLGRDGRDGRERPEREGRERPEREGRERPERERPEREGRERPERERADRDGRDGRERAERERAERERAERERIEREQPERERTERERSDESADNSDRRRRRRRRRGRDERRREDGPLLAISTGPQPFQQAGELQVPVSAADIAESGGPETPLGEGRSGPETPLGRGRSGPETPLGRGRSGPETPLGRGRSGPETPLGRGRSGPETPLGEGRSGPETPLGRGRSGPETPLGRGRLGPETPLEAPVAEPLKIERAGQQPMDVASPSHDFSQPELGQPPVLHAERTPHDIPKTDVSSPGAGSGVSKVRLTESEHATSPGSAVPAALVNVESGTPDPVSASASPQAEPPAVEGAAPAIKSAPKRAPTKKATKKSATKKATTKKATTKKATVKKASAKAATKKAATKKVAKKTEVIAEG